MKEVYIYPDKPGEERTTQELLVADLRKMKIEQADQQNFIPDAKECSVENYLFHFEL